MRIASLPTQVVVTHHTRSMLLHVPPHRRTDDDLLLGEELDVPSAPLSMPISSAHTQAPTSTITAAANQTNKRLAPPPARPPIIANPSASTATLHGPRQHAPSTLSRPPPGAPPPRMHLGPPPPLPSRAPPPLKSAFAPQPTTSTAAKPPPSAFNTFFVAFIDLWSSLRV